MAGPPAGGPAAETAGGGSARLFGAVLVLGVAFAWGSAWPVSKVALDQIGPLGFRAVNHYAGAACLFAIALLRGRSIRLPRRDILPLLLVALFNITLFHTLSAVGLSLIEAGRTTIIVYTFPIWSVAIGWFVLGEALTPGRLAALAIGIAALAVLIGPDLAALGRSPLGAGLVLLSSIAFALGTVYLKRFRWSVAPIAMAGWQLALGGLPGFLLMLAAEPFPDPTAWRPDVAAAMAYSIAVGMVFGHFAWIKALSLIPAAVASIASLSAPAVGVAVAALLLDEAIGWREWTALALVTAAMFMVFGRGGRRGKG